MEAVALGIGVRAHGGGHADDPCREVGDQPGELAAAAAERGADLLRVDRPGERLERLDEGPVRRADDRVAGAGEHQHAIARGVVGQFAHEPALARARLAAEQHHAAALTLGAGDQRPQLLELGRPTDERKR